VLGLSGSPSDGGTTHIQPPRAGKAASAAASTITVKYKDQSTNEPIPDYPDGNLVTSATATSQTVESTLDLSGQPDFFPTARSHLMSPSMLTSRGPNSRRPLRRSVPSSSARWSRGGPGRRATGWVCRFRSVHQAASAKAR
jgi:hypothetical protein